MTDLDSRASCIGESYFSGFGLEARQFVFYCPQCFEHLDSEKLFRPLLDLGTRQHSLPFITLLMCRSSVCSFGVTLKRGPATLSTIATGHMLSRHCQERWFRWGETP
jgi:hypothetical protein